MGTFTRRSFQLVKPCHNPDSQPKIINTLGTLLLQIRIEYIFQHTFRFLNQSIYISSNSSCCPDVSDSKVVTLKAPLRVGFAVTTWIQSVSSSTHSLASLFTAHICSSTISTNSASASTVTLSSPLTLCQLSINQLQAKTLAVKINIDIESMITWNIIISSTAILTRRQIQLDLWIRLKAKMKNTLTIAMIWWS